MWIAADDPSEMSSGGDAGKGNRRTVDRVVLTQSESLYKMQVE